MNTAKALIVLVLSSLFAPLTKAQLPSQSFSGNADVARASGVWESQEGVGIFCGRMTSLDAISRGESQAVCFVTEVQALGKDLPSVSTNTYIVQTWDKHRLVAETSFYADKDGNETAALGTSTKFVFRVVVDFDARSVSKFVEINGRTIGYHLKAAP
jgi:hypothetical protein